MSAAVVTPTPPTVAPEPGHVRPAPAGADCDRPPPCPTCHRRLVILASRSGFDGTGTYVRRQLWGCPRGHATTHYAGGAFGPIEVLPAV